MCDIKALDIKKNEDSTLTIFLYEIDSDTGLKSAYHIFNWEIGLDDDLPGLWYYLDDYHSDVTHVIDGIEIIELDCLSLAETCEAVFNL